MTHDYAPTISKLSNGVNGIKGIGGALRYTVLQTAVMGKEGEMRISKKLLRTAEERVQMIVDALNDCHPDDTGRRNRLHASLRAAEANLKDKRDMLANEHL